MYTAVPVGREAKVTDRIRWQQLAEAVLELRRYTKVLEQRIDQLEGGVSDLGWRKAEPQVTVTRVQS